MLNCDIIGVLIIAFFGSHHSVTSGFCETGYPQIQESKIYITDAEKGLLYSR